jgi:hypothetical protein
MSATFPTNGTTHSASSTDEAIDLLYSWMPPMVPAAPCPEAALSLTLRGTMRGQTPAEFKRNLEAVKGLLDAPTAPPAPTQPGTAWCAKHGVALHLNHGKDGTTWRSHRTPEGQWCKGR